MGDGDVLARIDAALDEVQACGWCRRALTPEQPPAFCGEHCQSSWQAAQVGLPPPGPADYVEYDFIPGEIQIVLAGWPVDEAAIRDALFRHRRRVGEVRPSGRS